MGNKNKRVAIVTLGCRVNQSESSVIEGTLKQYGVNIVGINEKPDYCIINTCTVTRRSDADSRQLIRKAVKSGSEVIVTGCYSELNRTSILQMQGITSIIPINMKDRIIGQVLSSEEITPIYHEHNRARPLLKVQDGCNFSCSYCAVPLARGRSRSIDIDEAVFRSKDIEQNGYSEIVLTGIHLGSYGHDLTPKVNLATLVEKILKNTDRIRIRLSSIEINEIDDALLGLLSDPRVCKHLHLPLQHGSDRILKLMNRNYTPEVFRNKIEHVYKINSDIAIGIDIIAGFPTETETDHETSLSFIESLPISYIHVFPYSVRPNTKAADMKPQISNKLIKERALALRVLGNIKKMTYATKYLGKTLDVIIEDNDDIGHMIGISSNYLRVQIESNWVKRGMPVFITLKEASDFFCRGVLIT